MKAFRAIVARIAGLFDRDGRDLEFQAELESHLQMHVDDNLRSGMTREEARRQALLKLGGVEKVTEAYREQRGLPFLETCAQDVRFALRGMRKNIGFTCVALLTLALGIGANTALFSVVNAVLLHPVATTDIDRLMVVRTNLPTMNLMNVSVGPGEALDLMARRDLFDAAGAWTGRGAVITEIGDPRRVAIARTMGQFFDVFHVVPALGRRY